MYTDDFFDVSVNMGDLQINFILQTGFFETDTEWNVRSHFHSCYEIHFVTEGSLELYVGDRPIILSENDICIIPPNLSHYTRNTPISAKKASLLFSLGHRKTHDNLNGGEYEVYSGIYEKMPYVKVINDSDIYEKYLKSILNVFGELSGIYKIRALFTLMFIEITKRLSGADLVLHDNKGETPSGLENTRIVKIENYINKNYMNDITLKDMANYLHLSKRQTDRTLEKLTGLNFGGLLLKKRMARASELILNSQVPINEIALQIGYSSYNGFYSAFKKMFGVTPSSLRGG